MTIAISITFFVLGLIIGSFLNVVILRLNTERSFGGRSVCMSCEHILHWYELVPVFSYFALRGRCRSCKTTISAQYPVVEFLTGFVFWLLYLKFQDLFLLSTVSFTASFAYYAAMFSLLIVIAVYDLKHKIIPDKLALVFGILAFLGVFFFGPSGLAIHSPNSLELLAGIFVAFPFAAIWAASQGAWMGLGDAKLSLGLGWLLGLSRALSAIVVAFWSGAIIGILLILFSKNHKMRSEIPFAPFLVLGAIIAFLFELHIFGF